MWPWQVSYSTCNVGIVMGPAELGIPCLLPTPILCPGDWPVETASLRHPAFWLLVGFAKGGTGKRWAFFFFFFFFTCFLPARACSCGFLYDHSSCWEDASIAPGLGMCSDYQCILPVGCKFTLQYFLFCDNAQGSANILPL